MDGTGVSCALLLALLVFAASSAPRMRRDVHRIIIKEEVAGVGRRNVRRPPQRDQEQRPTATLRRTKKPPPESIESAEDASPSFESDWKPLIRKNNIYPPYLISADDLSNEHRPPSAKCTPAPKGKPTTIKPIQESQEVTTEVARKKAPSVYKNNLKRMNHMNYFNYKITQNGDDDSDASDTSSASVENVEVPRRRQVKKQTQAKKSDGGYQVHEDVEGDTKPPKYTSFNALSPSLVKSVPMFPAVNGSRTVDRPKRNGNGLVRRSRKGSKDRREKRTRSR